MASHGIRKKSGGQSADPQTQSAFRSATTGTGAREVATCVRATGACSSYSTLTTSRSVSIPEADWKALPVWKETPFDPRGSADMFVTSCTTRGELTV